MVLKYHTGQQALEVERLLQTADEEEKQMRKFQMMQMKDSWETEMRDRKATKTRRDAEPDFNRDNAGPASLQIMGGEDPDRFERQKLQKEQMRRWIQEQLGEKAYMKQILREEDMSYAEMIRAIDEIREATEKEERELRHYIQEQMKNENKTVRLLCTSFNYRYCIALIIALHSIPLVGAAGAVPERAQQDDVPHHQVGRAQQHGAEPLRRGQERSHG